jgi:ABC-type phosphate transport system substrate-binding protein
MLLAAAVAAARPAPEPPAAAYHVVVNTFNPFVEITIADLGQLFLRKTETWMNGQPAMPVDQLERASVRQAFSVEVLGRPAQAVKAYWRQRIFSGRAVPPPELGSDVEVVEYVRANPYAIGYVAVDTPLGDGVRVITVTR